MRVITPCWKSCNGSSEGKKAEILRGWIQSVFKSVGVPAFGRFGSDPRFVKTALYVDLCSCKIPKVKISLRIPGLKLCTLFFKLGHCREFNWKWTWYMAGVRVHKGCLDVPMEQHLFLWSGAYTDCDDKQNSFHVESFILNLLEFPFSSLSFLHHEKSVDVPAGPCPGPWDSLIPSVLEITFQPCPQMPLWGKNYQAHGKSLDSDSILLCFGRTEDAFGNGNCIFRAFSIWQLLKGSGWFIQGGESLLPERCF